jgi:hypothetical protein
MARRGSSPLELKKKRGNLSLKIKKTSGGETLNTSVRNKNLSKDNSGSTTEKKKTTGSSKFIRYQGKMYKRGTPMAKKAEKAEAARKKLGAKNYMSKKKKK